MGSMAVGPPWCAGYVICDRLERPAVAIVAIHPRSLWTPLLWGRGSFVSCTVCTFTLNIQWRQPFHHPGGCIRGSTIYGNEFPRASRGRATYGDASPIRIAAMKKRLRFRHILDYTSILNWPTGNNQHFRFVCRVEVNIATEKRVQFRHRHWHRHILDYLTIRHRTTAYKHLRLKRNDNQHFHFVCRADDSIATETRLQFWPATVQQVMPILTRHRHWQHNPWVGLRGCVWESNDAPAGLCVTFGGAVDWKSWQLKPTAQSTTELRKHERENAHLGGAQGMAWFGFGLLSSVCFLSVLSMA